MVALINNISDGAGAYFLVSKKDVSILITPLNDIKNACPFVKREYSDAWFTKETAFIHKKLMEFMSSNDPFQLRKAIGNIKSSM